MLRLLDSRSGSHAEVRPGRPGLLRVGAHLGQGTRDSDWTGVRVQLVADLLARTAELCGLQVLTVLVFPGDPPAQQGFAERAAGLLGIHPPAARASAAEAPTALGGPLDVHITSPGVPDGQLPGLVIRAGALRVRVAGSRGIGAAAPGAPPGAGDPLALRFALLSRPHGQAADIDDDELARAREATARWRSQVADWAESPAMSMPQRFRTALDTAFGNLDMPRALQLLTGLAQEADVPDGARFEAFAFADRVLGLELARQVGRPRR